MNLKDARDFVRQFSRDAEDDVLYSPADIDRAIQYAGDHFCRATKCVRTTTTSPLTSGDPTVPLSTPIATANFKAERLIDAYIIGQPVDSSVPTALEVTDYPDLNGRQSSTATTGTPYLLAFKDAATAFVYPTPDQAYTLTLSYWLPFTRWTPGQASGAVVLNIDDEYIQPVLAEGACAVLKGPSPDAAYASAAWTRFLDYEKRMSNAGHLGARVVNMRSGFDGVRPRRILKPNYQ